MPKKTFYNLSEEKKNYIIQIAVDEFYKYGYEKSSVSRIVEKSRIAKGSFYQYFEGKDDIFRLIITIASEKKLEYLNNLISGLKSMDIFNLLRTLFMDSLVFQKENPKLAGIIDRFLKSNNSKLKETIIGEEIKKSNLFIESIMVHYVALNQIRSDLNLSFAAHLITGVALSLSDYVREMYDDIEKIDENIYKKLVHESIQFVKEGIEQKTQS